MAIVFGIVGVLLGARHINAFPEMNCVKGLNVNLDSARIAGATRKLRTAIAANLLLLAYGVVRPSGLLFLSLSNAGWKALSLFHSSSTLEALSGSERSDCPDCPD
jgi:hypothetical protein